MLVWVLKHDYDDDEVDAGVLAPPLVLLAAVVVDVVLAAGADADEVGCGGAAVPFGCSASAEGGFGTSSPM